jgi:NAD(P) transhydrogenase
MSAPVSYDLVVIGSGPAGEKAAVKAAYFGRKVALVEKASVLGGAGSNTGTLPSKTLKETALYYSGKLERGLYGVDKGLMRSAQVGDFLFRQRKVTAWAEAQTRANLQRHKVDLYQGFASFDDAHHVRVTAPDSSHVLRGEYVIIATGSYPFHPEGTPFDGVRVHDSDTILQLQDFPRSICIVGAGVIGCEYATIFGTMGTKVHLINDKDQVLSFLDDEIAGALVEQMGRDGIEIAFNASVTSLHVPEQAGQPLRVALSTGKTVEVDMFLFAAGRSGATKGLGCERAGVTVGKREAIVVDESYRTSAPNIYAVGDVIGFPALASTSMDQGRVAVSHIFKTKDLDSLPKIFPYGIYTVPEVSMVGHTERETAKLFPSSCVGLARHEHMPRGMIMGAKDGFLKLVFTKSDLIIRGVHIVGPLASELIHFGQGLVDGKKTLMDVVSTVFNYPTLHELYKYAAYDGLGNASGVKAGAAPTAQG